MIIYNSFMVFDIMLAVKVGNILTNFFKKFAV